MSGTSKLDIAATLAQTGQWNTLFTGTTFSLYGIVYDCYGGVDYNNSKWVTANNPNDTPVEGNNYYSWSASNQLLSQFIGIECKFENSITFMDLYTNEGNLLVSRYGQSYHLVSYSTDPNSAANAFPVEYAGVLGTEYVLLRLPIACPTAALISDSIGTYADTSGYAVFGLSILEMGDAFKAIYCNAAYSNLTNSFCIAFCNANTNICLDYQKEYCSEVTGTTAPPGAGTTYCTNWCGTSNKSNCDAAYELYCANKLSTEFGNDLQSFINSSTYHNICACFLPDHTMDGYRENLQTLYSIHVDAQSVECFYPPCLTNANSLKPYKYKTSCGNCTVQSGCILSVNIDYDGRFIAPPVTNQSKACTAFNSVDFSTSDGNPNDVAPTAPNACRDIGTNPISNRKNSIVPLIILVAIPLVLIGAGGIAYAMRNRNSSRFVP